jgi:RNA polymerase sigma factor (sigma-70 family)
VSVEKKFTILSHFRSVEYKPSNLTEQQILNGIVKREDKMYRFIYKYYFASVRSIVAGFHNNLLDTDDIFQEGLIAVTLNVEKGRFKGDSSFQTYLVAICRNLCLKKLDRQKKLIFSDPEHYDVIEEVYPGNEDQISCMLSIIKKMEDKCREIINLRFGLTDSAHFEPNSGLNVAPTFIPTNNSTVRFEVISDILGIEPDNARQRFKRCLSKLRALMVNDYSFMMTSTT